MASNHTLNIIGSIGVMRKVVVRRAARRSNRNCRSAETRQEIVAISCSWCKSAYHNKNQCYTDHLLTAKCDFGKLAQIVVPPTWIVKLPRKFQGLSSLASSLSFKCPRVSYISVPLN
ncbi:hypothetical protein BLOT_006108 [Blomia tropicalis]|nr:hypothetical protein BLOT_006108 [Blomia tropicalis]